MSIQPINTPPYYEFGSGGGGGIKRYKALVDQSGASAPVPTILENSLGTVTFNYVSTGAYNVISDGLFTAGKTAISITNVSAGSGYGEPAGDGDEIYLFSQKADGSQEDGWWYFTLIEITVYP